MTSGDTQASTLANLFIIYIDDMTSGVTQDSTLANLCL